MTLVVLSGPVFKSWDYGATWQQQGIVFSLTNDMGVHAYWRDGHDDNFLSTGAIVGIIIGVVVFLRFTGLVDSILCIETCQ